MLRPVAGSAGESGFGAWTGPGTSAPSNEAWDQFLRQIEEAKLTASNAAAEAEFGISVSVSGDTLVVGTELDDDAGTHSGAAGHVPPAPVLAGEIVSSRASIAHNRARAGLSLARLAVS